MQIMQDSMCCQRNINTFEEATCRHPIQPTIHDCSGYRHDSRNHPRPVRIASLPVSAAYHRSNSVYCSAGGGWITMLRMWIHNPDSTVDTKALSGRTWMAEPMEEGGFCVVLLLAGVCSVLVFWGAL